MVRMATGRQMPAASFCVDAHILPQLPRQGSQVEACSNTHPVSFGCTVDKRRQNLLVVAAPSSASLSITHGRHTFIMTKPSDFSSPINLGWQPTQPMPRAVFPEGVGGSGVLEWNVSTVLAYPPHLLAVFPIVCVNSVVSSTQMEFCAATRYP